MIIRYKQISTLFIVLFSLTASGCVSSKTIQEEEGPIQKRIIIEHFGSNRAEMPESVAQSISDGSEEETYVIVRNFPEIKGGDRALKNNIVVPDSFKNLKKEGFVSVDFIIDEFGKASKFNIVHSFTDAYNQAVIEALKITAFKPGGSRKESYKFYQNVEVRFKPAI